MWYQVHHYFYITFIFFNMQKYDYIITGMGASGLMLAYHMVSDSFFRQKNILIIDKEKKNKNDRTWSYWEKEEKSWDKIVHKQWAAISFASTEYSADINIAPYQYKTIRSNDFYEFIIPRLKQSNSIKIVYERLLAIKDEGSIVAVETDQGIHLASKVFNSVLLTKPHLNQKKYPVLNQHFIGWFVETKQSVFDDRKATFMDFTVAQKGNTRFMYVLPTSKTAALVEYTLFSEGLLERQEYEDEIKQYLQDLGVTDYKIVDKEIGCIPMTSYDFQQHNTENVLHMGTAGGWTKASTGFTFNNTMKNINKLLKYLKSKEDLSKFNKRSRFWYYDLLFLDVLHQHNQMGSKLFFKLFKRNKAQKILRFLDEETTVLEDLKITTSLPWSVFLKVLWSRIVKR